MKKLNRNISDLFIFILILFSVCKLYADDSTDFRLSYIGWFNYQSTSAIASFPRLPGVPNCCPDFHKGEGKGISVGLDFEFPLPYDFFTGFGIGFYDRSNLLNAFEFKKVRVDNNIVDAKIEHVIDAKINDISFSPFISYRLIGNLFLRFGANIGFLVNGTFHQYEHIVEPVDRGVFVDTGTRKRNDTIGTIPLMNTVYAGFTPEIHYDFKLNQTATWMISPSICYTYGLTDIVQNLSWRLNSLAIGIRLKYSPPIESVKAKEEYYEHSKIDTIIVLSEDYPKSIVKTGVEFKHTNQDKQKNLIITHLFTTRRDTLFKRPKPRINLNINLSELYLNGQFVTQAFPLVPVVFFGFNSSDIDTIYETSVETNKFHPDSLPVVTMTYQKNLLNIIGNRLKSITNAKLFIAGFCDSTTETQNKNLALQRAESVKSYLLNKWHIESSRLVIVKTNKLFPDEPTSTKNDSGFSENRRVELSTDNPKVLVPMKNRKFIEPRIINPPSIKVSPEGSTTKGIESWKFEIHKGEQLISEKSGKGTPVNIDDSLIINDFSNFFSDQPLILNYSLTDYEGQTVAMTKEIPVIADTFEFEIQRLSLILFGVANAELGEKAKNDIRVFIRDIKPNSIIRVTGYTDALGSFALNQKLSENRAKNTADFVRKFLPDITIEYVRGEASKFFPPGIYSYNSPIERFLSRTVFIELFNKIK